jgi:hypothetical protein
VSPELWDIFAITLLLNKAYFYLIATYWNSSFLYKSETEISPLSPRIGDNLTEQPEFDHLPDV